MINFSAVLTIGHALAAVVWVGGMFFAYMVLRPALGFMDGPQRLKTWNEVFARFFPWVWAAVFLLPFTGYAAVFVDFQGFGNTGMHIQLMHIIGMSMVLLYFILYFGPYRQFRTAVEAETWEVAAGHLNSVRKIVAVNLILGLITVALGASGRFWS